jgi:hypothetical protein
MKTGHDKGEEAISHENRPSDTCVIEKHKGRKKDLIQSSGKKICEI